MNQEEKLLFIDEIFTPSSPIENKELFSGRTEQYEQIRETLKEKGQHAIMYGHRGAGKTSLANMCLYLYKNLMSIKVNCNRNDSFQSIWERALRKISFAQSENSIGYTPTETVNIYPLNVPDQEHITPTEIEQILSGIDQNMLFIFDEFDIIKNESIKSQMADMLKLFSDNMPHITILIVGIAKSVENLIGEHPSIERCVKQIELPLMSHTESKAMIANNLDLVSLKIKAEIAERIIEFASGFPNYLHLLCKYAAREAVLNDQTSINEIHFKHAVIKSIENSDYSIKKTYALATKSSQAQNQFANVLLACALADTDENSTFNSIDVLNQYNNITGEEHKKESINYNLGMLCKKERAEILKKEGKPKKARYKFKKPLLKAFVRLKQYEETIK
jgi:Cdc6-like AAA superfamily ATPase